jgi:hypothetical protein
MDDVAQGSPPSTRRCGSCSRRTATTAGWCSCTPTALRRTYCARDHATLQPRATARDVHACASGFDAPTRNRADAPTAAALDSRHARCRLKDELDEWARTHPDRLTIVHVVGNKPDDPPPPGWKTTNEYTAESGWIDEKKIQKYAFEPSHDTLVFVCGLPPMYAALCGPRDTAALSDGCVLANLGYKTEMVAKL